MAESGDSCTHCGAPRVAGYAACKFCKTPFASVKNTQTNAIPCPSCKTLNELGVQKCVQCQTWVVVQCVFCNSLSPHNVPSCLKCGEAFAGAPQRFAERQSQQRLQTGLNVAGQVGSVAASLIGAAAMAGVIGGGRSSHHGYQGHGYHGHHGHRDDYDHGSGGGLLDSFGRSDSDGGGAGIEQSGDSSGGGFFDSIFGGDDEKGSSGSSGSSGGSFWDSGDSGDSDDSGDSGSFWDSDD